MRRKIVHDEVDPLGAGISSPDLFQEVQNDRRVLSILVMHPQLVLVDIVGAKEITDTTATIVGGRMSHRLLLRGPG